MSTRFTESELVLASHNKGKLVEIEALFAGHNISFSCAADYGLAEPVEDADSFKGNALIKARYVTKETGKAALSDDSGLSIPALDGMPGIHSARWAGEPRSFDVAMHKVKHELESRGHKPNGQKAYFVCALALVWPNGEEAVFEGHVHGTLTFPPKGEKGFGYDPIFIADGQTMTFAEMEPEKKHAMSHRADAFKQLLDAYFSA